MQNITILYFFELFCDIIADSKQDIEVGEVYDKNNCC